MSASKVYAKTYCVKRKRRSKHSFTLYVLRFTLYVLPEWRSTKHVTHWLVTMGIFYGLTAALCWGMADFLVTRLTRRIGTLRALFYIQLVGLLAAGAPLLVLPGVQDARLDTWALILTISLINCAGTLLLYRAFAIGTLALVSPIASAFAVISALLALAAGERPALTALLGALLLIGGVVVVSRSHGGAGRGTLAGVPEALGVALCFGIYFWAINFVTPSLGVFLPVLVTRAVELAGALLILVFKRGAGPLRLPPALWPLVLSAALPDTLAFVMFNLGVGSAYTAIVTALASLFSAVTVLLAWVFLRERLSFSQWAGVAVILLGVLLVSV